MKLWARAVSIVILLVAVTLAATRQTAQGTNPIARTTVDGAAVLVLPRVPDSPIPAGTVVAYAGGLIPSGWVPCDGSLVKIDTGSKRLAAALSTAYGGDGLKTFALPDLRGRVAVGLTNMGGGPASTAISDQWARSLGRNGYGGEASHQLAISEIPPHDHPGSGIAGGEHHHRISGKGEINHGKPGPEFTNNPFGPGEHTTGIDSQDGSDGGHQHTLTIASQGGKNGVATRFSIVQPSIAVHYLIKY